MSQAFVSMLPRHVSFPRWKKAVVLGGGAAYYLASSWQALARREDWPLSPFPMYSRKPPPAATRQLVVGLSERGEFELSGAQTEPFGKQRLKIVSHSLAKEEDGSLRRFFLQLAERYEQNRKTEHWPKLVALRAYDETWVVRPGLVGIDSPKRELLIGVYFPPEALLARLAAEAEGKAPPETALASPPGDVLLELDRTSCQKRCDTLEDPYASRGGASILAPTRGEPARLEVERELAAGRYFVFLRMRTTAKVGKDSVSIELDGEPVGKLGNYRETLTAVAWVWASAAHGTPPLVLEVTGGAHRLALTTTTKTAVDQLWLSRSLRELPLDNRARAEQ